LPVDEKLGVRRLHNEPQTGSYYLDRWRGHVCFFTCWRLRLSNRRGSCWSGTRAPRGEGQESNTCQWATNTLSPHMPTWPTSFFSDCNQGWLEDSLLVIGHLCSPQSCSFQSVGPARPCGSINGNTISAQLQMVYCIGQLANCNFRILCDCDLQLATKTKIGFGIRSVGCDPSSGILQIRLPSIRHISHYLDTPVDGNQFPRKSAAFGRRTCPAEIRLCARRTGWIALAQRLLAALVGQPWEGC
jgi:hypothetical protein